MIILSMKRATPTDKTAWGMEMSILVLGTCYKSSESVLKEKMILIFQIIKEKMPPEPNHEVK